MTDSTLVKMSSNKSYIVKAYYDWISDNDLTPYIVVDINVYGVLVPMTYAADGQIVLNIASSAVGAINLGSHAIEFSARFGGKLEHITVPYGAIGAIYAKENGAGTSLPIEHPSDDELSTESDIQPKAKPSLSSVSSSDKTTKVQKSSKGKATLKVIK
ncbi:MAG: ClpXP protease specificity-enhancing factor [Colwellia sp.]|nr:ClpXP protease specificity-enhancing factor [Colwellia sp.]